MKKKPSPLVDAAPDRGASGERCSVAVGSALQEPNWMDIALAYEDAAEHLERCAAQSEDSDERAALRLVAKRIRISGLKVKPNDAHQPTRRTDA